MNAYNCVVLAYGSHSENYLNIPGEKSFDNLISAKDFVSWYNGLPDSENLRVNLNCKKAIIIGAGNVAIDIARILLSPVEKLEKTDITAKSIELIKTTNKIEQISIVARRGILNAAFTIKELRELTKIESIDCRIDLKHFQDIARISNKLSRPRKRLTEFMFNIANKPINTNSNKILELVFLKTPLEIIGELDSKNDRPTVTGVKFKNNKYDFDFTRTDVKLDSEDALNALPVVEDSQQQIETISTDLVVRSIGFKNINIDKDIPFDKKTGTIPNENGKVIGKDGLYCTGWIKRGPRGVIVDTTTDANETAKKIAFDLKNSETSLKEGTNQIVEILKNRNVRFVDKQGWSRIDKEEIKRGKLIGKPREKFQKIEEMLKVALND
jgi:adrenodoxin-NADP+ reductase